MQKIDGNKLQIPGSKLPKSISAKGGKNQISNEIDRLRQEFLKNTGYYFYFKVLQEWDFEGKRRVIRVYIAQMIRETEEETDADFTINSALTNMTFIPAAPAAIRQDPRILPDDKQILLDFLANESHYLKKADSPVLGVKAIA